MLSLHAPSTAELYKWRRCVRYPTFRTEMRVDHVEGGPSCVGWGGQHAQRGRMWCEVGATTPCQAHLELKRRIVCPLEEPYCPAHTYARTHARTPRTHARHARTHGYMVWYMSGVNEGDEAEGEAGDLNYACRPTTDGIEILACLRVPKLWSLTGIKLTKFPRKSNLSVWKFHTR